MAFKDTARWQEQLCDTNNHRISGGSSSGLIFMVVLTIASYGWVDQMGSRAHIYACHLRMWVFWISNVECEAGSNEY